MIARALLIATVALAVLAPAAGAAPGQLDPSFGTGGQVRLLPSEENISLRGVATQPDGKIVLTGGNFLSGATLVVRLLENGALDPSFGASGIVNLALGAGEGEGRAVLVQPDGKIVIAGSAKGATGFDYSFARLNADGSPDLSFGGGDGKELVEIGPEFERAEAVALGPGGRIVATGEARLPGEVDAAGIAVLGSNGLPDPGYFGGDGAITITTMPKSDEGVAAALLADGRVLIADANGAGAGKGFTLVQLLPAGTPDPAFGGGDGLVEVPVPGTSTAGGRVSDFALLADGRIVASGYGFDDVGSPAKPDGKMAVARFLPDGQLDESFGNKGWFTNQLGAEDDSAERIAVAPNGKLVLAGPYLASGDPVSIDGRAVARLEAGGALDPTFGPGGFVVSGVTTPFGELFADAALDSKERLVFVARAYIGGGNTEIVVSRYLGDIEPLQAAVNQAPHARMKKVPKKVKASRLRAFIGTANDPDGAIARVQIAVTKVLPGGAKASAKKAPKCLRMTNARAKFKPAKPKGAKGEKRCVPRWLTVKGKAKWSFKLKKSLPPGRYVVYARAVDAEGLAESSFTRKAGNRYAFRVLADR